MNLKAKKEGLCSIDLQFVKKTGFVFDYTLSTCDTEHLHIVNVAKLPYKWDGHKKEHRLDHEDFKIPLCHYSHIKVDNSCIWSTNYDKLVSKYTFFLEMFVYFINGML